MGQPKLIPGVHGPLARYYEAKLVEQMGVLDDRSRRQFIARVILDREPKKDGSYNTNSVDRIVCIDKSSQDRAKDYESMRAQATGRFAGAAWLAQARGRAQEYQIQGRRWFHGYDRWAEGDGADKPQGSNPFDAAFLAGDNTKLPPVHGDYRYKHLSINKIAQHMGPSNLDTALISGAQAHSKVCRAPIQFLLRTQASASAADRETRPTTQQLCRKSKADASSRILEEDVV